VRDELKSLFPDVVRGAEAPQGEPAPLYAEELALVARAIDKRQREFALGRACARRALAQLGIAPQPLLANPDRSVCWPDAAWGSITHTDGLCLAVAARREHLSGIGIDAEVRGRVSDKLWSQIASEREIAWFRGAADAHAAAERATLLFSAKEAFYKAQFCVSRTFVGFHEAELAFDDESTFRVRLLRDVADAFVRGSEFTGRYTLLPGHVVTGLAIGPR
jgi:4'-phosphopantetheinyl transferase EntD